jgi:ribosomal protein S18 acetylase RimI-like enzyme
MLFESPLLTSLINTLIAKVRKDNDTAQSFWTKLGFRTVRMEADVVIMLRERFAGATHAKESIPTPCQQ